MQQGILGGGQLSLMLVEAAEKLGFKPLVLGAAAPDDVSLGRFLKRCEHVIFENEFVDCAALERISAELDKRAARFVPELSVISRVSEKLEQKKILGDLGIPMASYRALNGEEPSG